MTTTSQIAPGITGIVLAGGLSRRMGGGDKGLLEIAGRPMLAYVIERLAGQVGTIAINANGDPDRFARFGLSVVADTVDGFVGPLAGVLAGMRWAGEHTPEARWIATVSADAPLVPLDLVARLRDGVTAEISATRWGAAAPPPRPGGDLPDPPFFESKKVEGSGGSASRAGRGAAAPLARSARIAIAQSDGELHPVIGLWPVALADDLEQALRDGVRKVLAWTDRHGTVPVEFAMLEIAGQRVDPFFNANTPEELAQVRDLVAATARS